VLRPPRHLHTVSARHWTVRVRRYPPAPSDAWQLRDSMAEFDPDVILPAQFFALAYEQGLAKRGECRLLIAVLEDAIDCFQKHVRAR
jgi:hypothetical protein